MAEKVTLAPYPFPPGMVIPRLMPFQEYPWNGDGYLAAEVLRLKEKHSIRSVIETGTCLGSTTLWLRDNFIQVDTSEVNESYARIAQLRGVPTVAWSEDAYTLSHICPSVELLARQLAQLYFLDAHWGDHCPLLDELDAIAKTGVKHCIIIHDFQVPGTDFGFDKMPDGRPFNLHLIIDRLNAIYGPGEWTANYPTKVEGARRGWISIEPA